MEFFEASVIFERNIETNGNSYLTIYGKHANGYFCCIPNWNKGCEMAEPSDIFYNTEKLVKAGFDYVVAKNIAFQINETVELLLSLNILGRSFDYKRTVKRD